MMDKKKIFKGLNGGCSKVETIRDKEVVIHDVFIKEDESYCLFELDNDLLIGTQSPSLINFAKNFIECEMSDLEVKFTLTKTNNNRDCNVIEVL